MNGRMTALIAVLALALVAAVPLLPCASADDATDEPHIDKVLAKFDVKFTSTSSEALFLKWDFGDGTVLDGRWECYKESEDAELKGKYNEYKALLDAHGGDIEAPVHKYAENGVYTMTITAYNPVGWRNNGQTYTVDNPIETAGFDAGLTTESTAAKDVGSSDTKSYVIKIDATEKGDSFNWLPIIVIALGAIIAVVGLRVHPALIVVGAAVAVLGAVWALGYIDLGVRI